MNYKLIIVIGIIIASLSAFFLKKSPRLQPSKSGFEIYSQKFENNKYIPARYTCDGENINPSLSIRNVSISAKSLVLIVHDSDAGIGDWTHWLVWNIDPDTKEINSGQIPANAKQGVNDFEQIGWGGPCPPQGTHHYQFNLYSLDTLLQLDDNTKKEDLKKAITR